MNGITRFLKWLTRNFSGAIAITGHVVYIHDECPHCRARTLCEISAFHGHYRCLECGRSMGESEEPVRVLPRAKDKDLVAA